MYVVQMMPLPLTFSYFSKIEIGFTFVIPAHPGSLGQRAVKWVCVCACASVFKCYSSTVAQSTADSTHYAELRGTDPAEDLLVDRVVLMSIMAVNMTQLTTNKLIQVCQECAISLVMDD